jgi:hypothetical protein
LITAIDKIETRHRELNLRTSERGYRVRVGYSPSFNFFAASRTLLMQSVRCSVPRKIMAIVTITILTDDASTI